MSTPAKKKATAKPVFKPAEVVASVPPVDAVETTEAAQSSVVAPSIVEPTPVVDIGDQRIAVPRITPGRIVEVTVEAYPSHIVTRPAIVVSVSAPDDLINVHVFWDHFRDGAYHSPWRTSLSYSEELRVGTWRFPTRS